MFDQELAHVEADPAGTHDGHLGAGHHTPLQYIQVAHHLGVVVAGEIHLSRGHAGGDHHVVKAGQGGGIDTRLQFEIHAGVGDAVAEVAQGFVELFLARDLLGHVELAADLTGGIEQGDLVAALGRHGGAGQARRTRADHGDGFRRRDRRVVEFGFRACARIDQAARLAVLEHVVQTGLVAGDAGVDGVGTVGAGLGHPVRVSQQRARHRDHVGGAGGQDGFGHVRHVDAVGGHQRQCHVRLELGGDGGECGARYRGGDRRHSGLVPADAGVDEGGTGGFDRLGLRHDVGPAVAAIDQVQHRQAVDDDEVGAAGFAHLAHDLHREAHALCRIATPGVATRIGARCGELVQQVAFRAHDLDAVVAGVARQLGGGGEVADVAFDTCGRQCARCERINGRFQLRRRHRQRVVGVPAGVQQLHADLAVMRVHRGRHLAMTLHVPRHRHAAGEGLQPADQVRREATGDDQAGAACGAFGEIGGKLGEVRGPVLQARVHRSHQDPIAQGCEAEVEGRKQVGIGRRHGLSIPMRTAWCASGGDTRCRGLYNGAGVFTVRQPGSRADFCSGSGTGPECYAIVNVAFTCQQVRCTRWRADQAVCGKQYSNLRHGFFLLNQGAEHEQETPLRCPAG